MQNADGQVEEAHCISAGLDYPGIGPQHAHLKHIDRANYVSVTDEEALEAALKVARLEGIIPALETAHSFAYLEYLNRGSLGGLKDKIVVVNLSGSGEKDMSTYLDYYSKIS
jgi:tryptophan synthase beta chain